MVSVLILFITAKNTKFYKVRRVYFTRRIFATFAVFFAISAVKEIRHSTSRQYRKPFLLYPYKSIYNARSIKEIFNFAA